MKTIFRAASVLALMSAPAFAQTNNFYSFADTNEDGFLSQEELAAVSPAFTSTVYSEIDADESGDIVFEELSNSPYLRGFRFSSPAQFRREAPTIVRRYGNYRIIDANDDGFLSAGEISAVVPTVTRARYSSADLNADGVLDFNELYGWRFYTTLEDRGAVLLPRDAADQDSVVLDRVRYTRIDLNRDGFISMSELARIAPEATLAQYAAIDANNDGVVVYRELYDSDIVNADIAKGSFVIPDNEVIKTAGDNNYVLDSYTYALLDTDDDNLMTLDELRAAIPTFVDDDIEGVDLDGDGFIRYDEFFTSPTIVRYYDSGSIVLPTTRTVSVERSYFTGIDLNRNGVIEENELTEVSPAATRTVYTEIDADTDGVVTYDELYGSGWFTQALADDSFITPAYTYRYYAPKN